MRKVAFYTLGCKVNQQETDAMRALFERAGYEAVPFEEPADVYVVNTCTVTQVSDKKSRQMIARAHARNPAGVIAVVGCYAQRAPEEVKNMPGVRLIVGTQHRARIVELVEDLQEQRDAVEDIRRAKEFETLPTAAQGTRTRAQLKIQDGCDRFCSYCIIPYARGPVRSRPLADVEAALRALGEAGAPEVVLTGIHLMSYGKDLPDKPNLGDVVRIAGQVSGIGRIRLGSLEPALVDDAFVSALLDMPNEKLARQFHLSLQSGSEGVLSRMRRRYTPHDYEAAANRLRKAFPGCALTTDIIAGFPGETEEEHKESLKFAEHMAFSRIHVFPYSRRSGTAAAELPGQIQKAVKERRAHELIALGERMERAYLREQIGTVQLVLSEETDGKLSEGYAGNYVRVRYPGGGAGALERVTVTGMEDGVLIGTLTEE
ncbi:MAG TPA: tRNA (N(6)-L-threonylcarbamoyladenosine(37)-C(2))-methylthiotransferase MtaB [Feifaniaceae bacterium]|nr:tRNA (N(6)-L-threonylcarbamoyladenosine(37)-C(2))-methylthiotransferase MtaB [Feifaniaceae bacterium]